MASLPTPGTDAALWLVDGDHSFFDALTWMDQLNGNTVKILNVDEVVRACARDAVQNSRTLDFLAIFGHGTGGYQSTGAGKTYEWTGTKSLHFKGIARPGESLLVGPAEEKIRGLNGVLSDGATVFLGGCNVGDGNQGDGLLTTLSGILDGRTVQAFENTVYWWTGVMVGMLKSASGSSVSSSFAMLDLYGSVTD